MRKYLIQDITPPGKKHVTHPHKAKTVHDVDGESPKKSHPHPVHIADKNTHHTGHTPVRKSLHEEEIPVSVGNEDIEITHIPPPVFIDTQASMNDISPKNESVVGNSEHLDPRTMLVDKIIEVSPKIEEKNISHTPSYFNDAINSELPQRMWHSSDNKQTESSHAPFSSMVRSKGLPNGLLKNSITPWKGWIPWIMGIVIIAILGITGLNYYSGVDILIIQKHDSIPMDEKITVVKTPMSDELSYAIVVATTSVSREVSATEEKVVTSKASGRIIIYNTQNVIQRLIRNTRFQSTAGKIYRINDSINIPKATMTSGKLIPGNIAVVVFADEAGPDYNSAPSDFTVPGLKGSKIFDMVYARGQGAISGGASGTTKSVSDQDLKQASDDLRVQLETKLRSEVRSSIASWATKISYDSGVVVELGDVTLPSVQSSASDKAVVSQEGTIYLVTFDRQELTNAIAKSLIPTFKGEPVSISNIDGLQVEMPKMTGEELMASEKLTIALKGTPSLEWAVDKGVIKNAILGISKKDFNSVMKQFPTVERAVATIQPVWKTTFPLNPNDIKIKIVTSIPE